MKNININVILICYQILIKSESNTNLKFLNSIILGKNLVINQNLKPMSQIV